MSDAPRRAPRPGLLLALVLGGVAAAYQAAAFGGFVWDDHALIVGNPVVHHLGSALGAFVRGFWARPLAGDAGSYYRPLLTLVNAGDWTLGGGQAWVFHLTSLGLHLAVCVAVFALARRLGAGGGAAALATAAFGVFPRLTESVAWISGRSDVLAAGFALLVLLLWRPGWRPRLAAAGAFGLGLLSKEVAAAAVVGVVVWELAAARRDGRPLARALWRPWPLYLGAAIYGGLRVAALGPRLAAAGQAHLGLLPRAGLALQTLGTYLTLILDPLRPRVEIGRVGVARPGLMILGGAVLLFGVALSVWAWRRWPPARLAAAATAVAALVPVLHLVPIPVQAVAADRFLYLPLAAALPVGAAWATGLAGRWRWVLASVAGAAVLTFAGATYARVPAWRTDLALWHRAVATHGDESGLPWAGLGQALLDRHRPREALAAYDRAISLDSRIFGAAGEGFPFEWSGKAACLEALGRYDEAVAVIRDLARRFPGHPRYHYDLAMAQLRALRFDAAEATLARRPDPDPALTGRLRRLVARTRREVAALPPPGRAASLEARRAWAELDDRLGRTHAARGAFAALAADPQVSPALLRRAAGWLALKGDRASAEEALRRLGAVAGPDDPQVAALRQALADRFADPGR